ncbi:MAG: hypothetical protein ACT4OE_09170 [Sphingosinicella sp.]
MKMGRILLALGALVLIATAFIHASGLSMVSSWLSGERGEFLKMLWLMPSLDWIVVGLLWLFLAWRPIKAALPLVWLTALIPFGVAAALVVTVGPGFFGLWLLTAAILLAAAGTWRILKKA